MIYPSRLQVHPTCNTFRRSRWVQDLWSAFRLLLISYGAALATMSSQLTWKLFKQKGDTSYAWNYLLLIHSLKIVVWTIPVILTFIQLHAVCGQITNLSCFKISLSSRSLLLDGENLVVNLVTRVGSGLWVAFCDECNLNLYHLESLDRLQEINLTRVIRDFVLSKSSNEHAKIWFSAFPVKAVFFAHVTSVFLPYLCIF